MSNNYIQEIKKAKEYIQSMLPSHVIPEICIVLGSGLAPLTSMCKIELEIPYAEIPGFPVSTVPGHEGRLIVGELSGKKVFLMSGRFHYYEGYDMNTVTFYVRVMALLKVKYLIMTNAAGGLGENMHPSELMVITDHLSFGCESPLRGQNLEEFGTRFPDQSEVYDRGIVDKIIRIAQQNNITLTEGIYSYSKGPQFETPAEISLLAKLGVSAVGMSTVPEAIVATHCGMKVAAISCITNLAAGMSDNKLTHAEVIENAAKASGDCCKLVELLIAEI